MICMECLQIRSSRARRAGRSMLQCWRSRSARCCASGRSNLTRLLLLLHSLGIIVLPLPICLRIYAVCCSFVRRKMMLQVRWPRRRILDFDLHRASMLPWLCIKCKTENELSTLILMSSDTDLRDRHCGVETLSLSLWEIFKQSDMSSNKVKHIDYYFSQDNLCRDLFLRQNMDEQSWVPISLIVGFNRVGPFSTILCIWCQGSCYIPKDKDSFYSDLWICCCCGMLDSEIREFFSFLHWGLLFF